MPSSRYTVVGLVARFAARRFAHKGLPIWSPKRWAILAVTAVVPPKVLGYLTLHGSHWYLGPQYRWFTRPGPGASALIVAAFVGLALNRERLPDPVASPLLR
ncbi:MAG: hypothetical protein JHC95_14445 [Solirubrobacteraceae bacterium]|nr:hypothetical protein [Solirubrobacteraceae bacterium]